MFVFLNVNRFYQLNILPCSYSLRSGKKGGPKELIDAANVANYFFSRFSYLISITSPMILLFTNTIVSWIFMMVNGAIYVLYDHLYSLMDVIGIYIICSCSTKLIIRYNLSYRFCKWNQLKIWLLRIKNHNIIL